MAFLKTGFVSEMSPLLRGHRIVMRPPAPSDYSAWAELRDVSRDHLIPWEPKWARDELSRWAYRRRLRYYQRDQREDHQQGPAEGTSDHGVIGAVDDPVPGLR